MPIVEWNDGFVLGVQEFDEHHKHLVGLLNRAYDDFTAGAPTECVDDILDELADYATYHFATEENWMREHSYPKLDEHCAEHARFAGRVTQMLNDQRQNKGYLLLEVMSFLNNWLTRHILQVDAEYGQYIAAKGVPIRMV